MELMKYFPADMGVEIAKYALKSSDLEPQMLAMAKRLETEFLQKQPGYLGAMILKDKEGIYTDIVFTETLEQSEALCAKWMENDLCKEYLNLIDEASVEMRFLNRIK